MVENFLTNSGLSDARAATGTEGIGAEQVQVVEDSGVCQQLDQEYTGDEFSDYDVNYYEAGDFYFVTVILEQPDDLNLVRSGSSFIYVYDENLNLIKGYGG